MNKESLFESDYSKDLFLKYLLTGGLAGGTIAGAKELVKLIKDVDTRADQNPVMEKEGPVIEQDPKLAGANPPHIGLPDSIPSGGSVSDFIKNISTERPGVSGLEALLTVLGAAGTGYAGYKGVENIMQAQKKKDLEQELEQQQRNYFDLLGGLEQPMKAANFGAGGPTGALYMLLALASLAGGTGAYQLLEKNFPKTDPTRKLQEFSPVVKTKIDLPEDDTQMPEPKGEEQLALDAVDEDDTTIPPYSLDTSERVLFASADTQRELMLHAILGDEKRASVSGFEQLVNCVAAGKGAELWKQADSIDDLFAQAKEQNDSIPDEMKTPERKQLAVTYVSSHPGMSKAVEPCMCSEMCDMSPHMFMIAKESPRPVLNAVNGLIPALIGGQRKKILIKLSETLELDTTKVASCEDVPYEDACWSVSNTIQNILASDVI